jgi:hypothetical protein
MQITVIGAVRQVCSNGLDIPENDLEMIDMAENEKGTWETTHESVMKFYDIEAKQMNKEVKFFKELDFEAQERFLRARDFGVL